MKTVEYRGYAIRVPATWPVYSLSKDPEPMRPLRRKRRLSRHTRSQPGLPGARGRPGRHDEHRRPGHAGTTVDPGPDRPAGRGGSQAREHRTCPPRRARSCRTRSCASSPWPCPTAPRPSPPRTGPGPMTDHAGPGGRAPDHPAVDPDRNRRGELRSPAVGTTPTPDPAVGRGRPRPPWSRLPAVRRATCNPAPPSWIPPSWPAPAPTGTGVCRRTRLAAPTRRALLAAARRRARQRPGWL